MLDKRTPRPASPKKAAASRANGAKSRGPLSPEGKARSSQNAIRHGGYRDAILLGNENQADLEALCVDFTARFNPIGLAEIGLVEEMAVAHWRIRRYWFAESATLDMEMARQQPDLERECEFISEPARLALAIAHLTSQPGSQTLQFYQRIESRLRRHYSRALSDLLKIQQLRLQTQPAALPAEPAIKNDETNPPASQPPSALPLAACQSGPVPSSQYHSSLTCLAAPAQGQALPSMHERNSPPRNQHWGPTPCQVEFK